MGNSYTSCCGREKGAIAESEAQPPTSAQASPPSTADFRRAPQDVWESIYARFAATEPSDMAGGADAFSESMLDVTVKAMPPFAVVEDAPPQAALPQAIAQTGASHAAWPEDVIVDAIPQAAVPQAIAQTGASQAARPEAAADFRRAPQEAFARIYSHFDVAVSAGVPEEADASAADREVAACASQIVLSMIYARLSSDRAEDVIGAATAKAADGDFRQLPQEAWDSMHAQFAVDAPADSTTEAGFDKAAAVVETIDDITPAVRDLPKPAEQSKDSIHKLEKNRKRGGKKYQRSRLGA